MKTTSENENLNEADLDCLNYDFDSEEEWRSSSRHPAERELLEIFPESKEILAKKIERLKKIKTMTTSIIKRELQIIKEKSALENQWFWEEVVKVFDGWELIKLEEEIARIQRLFLTPKELEASGRIPEEKIKQAASAPIEMIADQNGIKLRKSGRSLVGLCPFHEDRRPSFCIYPDTNSFYCYGCQKGGDAIKFVELLYGYSFREAVEFLDNNY
ncbi:MAG: CHC2 zinc finger domain-containing protein [Candidatus Paceibacterota bacterium]